MQTPELIVHQLKNGGELPLFHYPLLDETGIVRHCFTTRYGGVKSPEGTQGRSFKDVLAGKTPKDWRKSFYYRYWTQHDIRPAHIGVRNERYKLMFLYGDRLNMTGSSDYKSTPSWEFYDLQKDPKENHNAYGEKEYESVIREMKKEMMRLREEVKDTDEGEIRMMEILRKEGLEKRVFIIDI